MLVILVVSIHTTRLDCSLELRVVSPFPSLSPTFRRRFTQPPE